MDGRSTSALIADYEVAYERANGKKVDFHLSYKGGWFVFEGWIAHERMRREEFEKCIGRLSARALARTETQ